MKNNIRYQLMAPALLALSTLNSQLSTVFAQASQFFRIAGPTATKITAFQRDGTMVWSNATPGATYTVQTVTALPGGNNWVDYKQISASNSVCTNLIFASNPPAGMALIPAGTFTMGDPLDSLANALPTSVTVSAFYMDMNLVSSNQWRSVYVYATAHGYGFVHAGAGKAANHPVQKVDWYDVVKWSNARSQQAGLTPVYYTDAGLAQVYTNGEPATVYPNWAVSGYRLPTEAEWEKAARGGLSGQRFPWGNTISESQANYNGSTGSAAYDLGPDGYNVIGNYPTTSPGTSPVGSFAPNGYGLYDMAGNVFEWVWDWYATPYAGGTDPRGPVGPLTERVLRAGDWEDYPTLARCAYRFKGNAGADYIGFRCVRGL